ncbi:Uu.00g065300.m01.CDS01 [Anthostomella pinea]|uniref:Uu.00g065300.m01.CDS01 n=1 Tax=Anthostomella pinea TaxID=933095 RepID=A0AAI8VUJ1_9PEZI|nr:Uu.00g065300.m01.CDS01 [Anthostomella pinea]
MAAHAEKIETDVVICGSGSAGICAAVWLAQAGIDFHILEQRSGPLAAGQADGVQCRTVEIFDSMGIAEELLRESYHVNELTFWSMDEKLGRIKRTSRAPDTPVGISHQPHVILNQARINGLLLSKMHAFAPDQQIDYDHTVTNVVAGDASSPVEVHATHQGHAKVFKAKYVIGCDGAHSKVRRSLGIAMEGDSTDAIWGVMDSIPRTDFPDIRRKVTLHTPHGATVIIPREGGRMARFYLQVPPGTNREAVTLESLQALAKSIFQGYQMDFAETMWFSAYPIGQRLASSFSAADGRIFLAGDACHTHSPKAGQGMNVSLQDGHNIGWKLAQVLRGRAPAELMTTYVLERQKVASDLIAFDKMLTALYHDAEHDPTAAQRFQEAFLKSARYMAGFTGTYQDSMVTSMSRSNQALAKSIAVGMRLPNARVVRHCDALSMDFQKAFPADNRWRIVVFIGDLQQPQSSAKLLKVADFLTSSTGPIPGSASEHGDPDEFIETLLVIAGNITKVEIQDLPEVFRPVTGKYKIHDLYKVYVDDFGCDDRHGQAYEAYGISPEEGAVVVVRPDQYVSSVTSLEDHQTISDFFSGLSVRE